MKSLSTLLVSLLVASNAMAFDPLPSSDRACDSIERDAGLQAGSWRVGAVQLVQSVKLQSSGGAKVLGAAIGTAAGVAAGKGQSYPLQGVYGMVFGAVGSKIAEQVATDAGELVFIKFDGQADLLSVAQETSCKLRKGDVVLVSNINGKTRVVRADK